MIIGLDVGGTHTDVVLMGKEGLEREVKVPTAHDDLFNTVLTGLEKATKGIDQSLIKRVVLSTTLTTNAIVQNRLDPVGIIVASGPGIDPEFFRTNDYFFCVSGAIDHRGRETEPIDHSEIEEIKKHFKKEGIRYAGVVGKFSVRNPEHELAIANILESAVEKVFMGHRISGKLNFPRRIASTFLNASVHSIHKNFFEAVRKSLEKKNLKVPIHILKADGGTMNFESSLDFPGQTILSGPAASVMGSIAFGSKDGEDLVLDIGGTTTDMAILINRVPILNSLGIKIGPYKSLVRSLETRSIGIGGDSHVRIHDGQLQVGPERLGPAMAYGGGAPTPTDALVALGLISDVKANTTASVEGLKSLSTALGKGVPETAQMIFDYTCDKILSEAEKMIRDINSKPVYTVHEVLEEYMVKPQKILVLGGPANHFAENLEKRSGKKTRKVPRWSVANAIGAALARTTCELTLFVDTQLGIATAPEAQYSEKVPNHFSRNKALKIAYQLLQEKALKLGAHSEDLAMEIIEDLQFNMVRGFNTAGKNMRFKVQVKPGLIHGYERIQPKN